MKGRPMLANKVRILRNSCALINRDINVSTQRFLA